MSTHQETKIEAAVGTFLNPKEIGFLGWIQK